MFLSSSDTIHRVEFMSTIGYSPSNSTNSDQENILDDDYVIVSSSTSIENIQDDNSSDQESDLEYFSKFSWPEDSDDDLEYFYGDNNDDLFLNNHLDSKKLNLINKFEEKNYQRVKRSNKKINAQRQIKTKYAQTIKIKSHNKQLYMHHRLVKQVHLDPPSQNAIPSPPPVPLYSLEVLRSFIQKRPHVQSFLNTSTKNQPSVPFNNNTTQFHEYTINERTIPTQEAFDDGMIAFLLDIQNRDLSPEDYEILLRLDERVQRKTLDTNILNTLPTINVNETHLTEQCTICMENYILEQQLKLLPCKHIFHSNCIETYLKEFSIQCPLDNLPLI